MDPDANLKEQLTIAKRIIKHADAPTTVAVDAHDAEALAERVIALNEWIKRGGFLPAAWRHEETSSSKFGD